MKHIKLLYILPLFLLLAACGEEKPTDTTTLYPPEDIRLSAAGQTSMTFSWSAADNAVRYSARLELASDASDFKTSTVSATSVTFTGLTQGQTYIFRVRSLGAGNQFSDYSEPFECTLGQTDVDPDPEPDPTPGGDSELSQYYESMMIPSAEDEHKRTLAFPGAEGGGMYVTGGRGGQIIHVTNLNDSGTGSLRAALSTSGPRIIVFDVAGIINLNSRLNITNGDVTIAGQTAPGDGICIAGNTVQISASNVIIRFMRFRLGDQGTGLNDGSDAIWGRYNENIILDHCSMSWSIDEVASFYANCNFTMQWCTIAEALNSSVHNKGDHGYGGIWGGKNASFHHNLLANNNSRNARIDHPGVYGNYLSTHRGNVDYRNNVIYNWGSNHTYGGEDGYFNIVGNYYKAGPASSNRQYYVDAYWYNSSSKVGTAYPELYIEDNYNTLGINSNYPNGIYYHNQGDNPDPVVLDAPLSIMADGQTVCYTTTHSVNDAYSAVLSYAGASLVRDAVDERIVRHAQNGTYEADGSDGSRGGIIDSQNDVGGWPEYSETTSNEANDKTDSDNDGIPDWFEDRFGLDASNPSDASETGLDIYGRYTNFEMYLHYLVRNIVAGQATSGTYTALD